MARGINKVILIGNLGADPETRYTQNGQAMCRLRVATSESWRDRETNETQERTEWHSVVCFRRLGEIAGEYLRKGSKVYIEGKLRTRKWQDQNGQDRYSTEIIADDLQMLDGRGGGSGGGYSPQQGAAATGQGAAADPGFDSGPNPASDMDLDDDIPF